MAERPIVVLKVGTSSLVDNATGQPRLSSMARLAEVTRSLLNAHFQVVVVSSGAVGLGCARLGLKERPSTVAGKQAAAAVGQVALMSLYDDLFATLKVRVAQVLLTYDTFGDRVQWTNASNTMKALLEMGVVPIINENDTVAVNEIKVGDNDTLSALVGAMIGASWLFLLTDVPSLYTANPRVDAGAAPIRTVPSQYVADLRRQMADGVSPLVVGPYTPSGPSGTAAAAGGAGATGATAGGAGSAWGTGGMATKLKAAEIATAAGATVVITETSNLEALTGGLTRAAGAEGGAAGIPPTLFADAAIGTTLLPAAKAVTTGRKRWILSLSPKGRVCLDAGAVRAVVDGRKSLFPAGVTEVTGRFDAEDAVSLVGPDGVEVARALVNYAADDLRRIAGKRSAEAAAAAGAEALTHETVANRDRIVVLKGRDSVGAVAVSLSQGE